MDALQAAHPHAAIIGGLATGRYLLHAHAHKLTVLARGGIVGLTFGGNVPMHALVCAPRTSAEKRLKQARPTRIRLETLLPAPNSCRLTAPTLGLSLQLSTDCSHPRLEPAAAD